MACSGNPQRSKYMLGTDRDSCCCRGDKRMDAETWSVVDGWLVGPMRYYSLWNEATTFSSYRYQSDCYSSSSSSSTHAPSSWLRWLTGCCCLLRLQCECWIKYYQHCKSVIRQPEIFQPHFMTFSPYELTIGHKTFLFMNPLLGLAASAAAATGCWLSIVPLHPRRCHWTVLNYNIQPWSVSPLASAAAAPAERARRSWRNY